MAKFLSLWILAGSIAGGIIYSLFVSFFDYFTPITGILAGFAGCILLIASPGEKKDLPNKYILMYIGLSILSLLFGYVSLYYVKAEVVHGTSFHPVDIITFTEFMRINFGLPDIFSAILGGLIAYGLSDKIAASIRGIFSSRSRYG
jgi:hypothetical protein